MNIDIHSDNKDEGYKTHTNQSATGTHNSHPKDYSQVEFFCNKLQLNLILTQLSEGVWQTPY